MKSTGIVRRLDNLGRIVIPAELSETDMKHIYPILNYRYLNYLPTIVSSECTPNMLLELDEALGGRILETTGKRFLQTFKGDCNYRLRKFAREGNE